MRLWLLAGVLLAFAALASAGYYSYGVYYNSPSFSAYYYNSPCGSGCGYGAYYPPCGYNPCGYGSYYAPYQPYFSTPPIVPQQYSYPYQYPANCLGYWCGNQFNSYIGSNYYENYKGGWQDYYYFN